MGMKIRVLQLYICESPNKALLCNLLIVSRKRSHVVAYSNLGFLISNVRYVNCHNNFYNLGESIHHSLMIKLGEYCEY